MPQGCRHTGDGIGERICYVTNGHTPRLILYDGEQAALYEVSLTSWRDRPGSSVGRLTRRTLNA
jgi:hypothetical protein